MASAVEIVIGRGRAAFVKHQHWRASSAEKALQTSPRLEVIFFSELNCTHTLALQFISLQYAPRLITLLFDKEDGWEG